MHHFVDASTFSIIPFLPSYHNAFIYLVCSDPTQLHNTRMDSLYPQLPFVPRYMLNSASRLRLQTMQCNKHIQQSAATSVSFMLLIHSISDSNHLLTESQKTLKIYTLAHSKAQKKQTSQLARQQLISVKLHNYKWSGGGTAFLSAIL